MEDELNPSELGTQSYWQEAYSKELRNFEQHGDTGEVWFGEDSALRVIECICNCGIEKNAPIIDLGCGNGYTLLELAREGFTNLLGVDYCTEAIDLAQKVCNAEFPSLRFQVFDIVNDDISKLGSKFSVIHDKGTYDAIGLCPDNAKINRLKYMDQVYSMLEDNGIFVITSCNWTEEELKKQFSEKFKVKQVIPSPQFKFGGKVGSVVSSVVFVKQ
ncbi:unnamed protein product [Leptidea sinapis]|uniref:Protein-lysine N-methyltransferase LSINAPIS_LOCUS1193 n=1 Tax=Leptidea sinapis TaxID=189913 RepID=A0A5E4PRF2_9NEOP|nr:unnamed protein product [Leptidea sinapis]